MRNFRSRHYLLMLVVGLASCLKPVQTSIINLSNDQITQKSKTIVEKTPIKLADGLKIDLWAADTLSPDPVAMSINDVGDVFFARTIRQNNSEFDIRGYRDWMIPSISFQTVEDRRGFLRTTFDPSKSDKNGWLKDLNNDGSHDWRDLTVEEEEIWKLEDTNGDGRADRSTRVFKSKADEVTDCAEGILVRENDAFVAIAPDLWRLEDKNKDGIYEKRTSISHGWQVHIGFGAHGLGGIAEGPDGKIYWKIGDIGMNVVDKTGKKHAYPNEGVIVRSNPDGSDFEVVAHGLRNTHEFVFDEYGNIITSDNDGDHPGESERLAHVVEGCDFGWRSNWQYGKYVDPKNNKYNVWMDEKLFKPRWEGQAAYILPPIRNFHNGPTGMIYNPGTALGTKWKNKFFLTEFVGSPSNSPIWAFSLKPKGASFDFDSEVKAVEGILPTGIKFGPDGAIYAGDWVTGWGTKNYGRIWKIDVDNKSNDLADQRFETANLMKLPYGKQSEQKLKTLMAYEDMRIRQKAQFELAKRGNKSLAVFKDIAQNSKNQLARVHAIWGIGQLADKEVGLAQNLVPLLTDPDEEIIAQAIKVMGDVEYAGANATIIKMLDSSNPRIAFFAAQTLGRTREANAIEPLIALLKKNNDQDNYLRHAAVLALSRIGQTAPIIALKNSSEKSLRLAAVLVLRQLKDPAVQLFLNDEQETIATDAARAINDDLSIAAAMPALAMQLNQTKFTNEAFLRRSINACLRIGGEANTKQLFDFIERTDINENLKAEAISALSSWTNPSVCDRVDGRYRGELNREAPYLKTLVASKIKPFLNSTNQTIATASINMLSSLGIADYNEDLTAIQANAAKAEVRSAALQGLSDLKYAKIEENIKAGLKDKDRIVRTTAIGLVGQLKDVTKDNLRDFTQPIFENGAVGEQQQLLRVLGEMPIDNTRVVLEDLITKMSSEKLTKSVKLDLLEAIEATKDPDLAQKAATLKSSGSETDAFKETMYGGSFAAGREYFNNGSAGQCTRCHTVGNEVGTVGPSLRKIGNTLSREQILQALIEPSARLSPGYGTVALTLEGGEEVTGILIHETDQVIELKTNEAEPLKIPLSRIKSRQNYPSAMPPMGSIMTKREIRDVVEYLSSLR